MELRVGIAGAGAMGRNHARVYNSIDGVRLEGVYDVDRDRAEALTANFGGKVVSSLDKSKLVSTIAFTANEARCYHFLSHAFKIIKRALSN